MMIGKTGQRLCVYAIVCVVAAVRMSTANGGLPEDGIVSALPKGPIIAAVACKFNEEGTTQEKRKAIVAVKILPDADPQFLVGYYTEGVPPYDDKEAYIDDSTFFRRCHVAIVGRKGKRLLRLWDSGGWGCDFGIDSRGTKHTDAEVPLLFNAIDLNGDGRAEVVFSRASFNAEGSSFEIWEYDETEGRMMQRCRISGSVRLIYERDKQWAKLDVQHYYASQTSWGTWEFDPVTRRYTATKWITTETLRDGTVITHDRILGRTFRGDRTDQTSGRGR